MKIIILHGWAYDTTKWKPLLKQLNALGLDVALPKIPVLTQKEEKPWTMNDYMNWLAKEVGDTPTILIGHSNGGRLALNFAVRYPQRITQLILIDSAGIPRTELSARLKRSVLRKAAKVGKKLTKSATLRKALYKIARTPDYLNADGVAQTTMTNLLQSDYQLDLSKVKIPVSVIWGHDDRMTPLKDAYTFQRDLPNVRDLKVIEGARHAPQFTHTQQVVEFITKAVSA